MTLRSILKLKKKKEVVGSIVRNFNRKDIWVEKSIIKEHFKGCFFIVNGI